MALEHGHIVHRSTDLQSLHSGSLNEGAGHIVIQFDIPNSDIGRIVKVCFRYTEVYIASYCQCRPINLRIHRCLMLSICSLSLLDDSVEYDVFPLPVYHGLCCMSSILKRPVGSGKYFSAETSVDQHAQRKVFIPEGVCETDHGIGLLVAQANHLRIGQGNPCFIHDDFSVMRTGCVCYSFELGAPDISVPLSCSGQHRNVLQTAQSVLAHPLRHSNRSIDVFRKIHPHSPVASVRSLECVTGQGQLKGFVFNVSSIYFHRAVSTQRVERDVEELSRRIGFVVSKIDSDSILKQTRIKTDLP